MRRKSIGLFFLVAIALFIGSEPAHAGGNASEPASFSSLTSKPLMRARSEMEVKKLRQLVAARKIDADQLLRAIRDITNQTSQR